MLGFSGQRDWIYTRSVSGRFQTLHRISGIILQGILVLIPWIPIGGHPAVRIDLPARRLYFFGQIFTAADGFLIVLAALFAAFALFFVSALFGRLWCGYFCPQTVFLEEWVRPIELFFEGDAGKRKRRDAGARDLEWLGRRAGKYTAFLVVAVVVSMSTMSWFGGAYEMWTGRGGSGEYTMVAIIAGGLMVDWVWFREQLCIYLCPYARFQSALTDDESLIISFDSSVGIGKGKKAVEAGECIDCKSCVSVCPQGIDIRDGFQLECISCARCIDACDEVLGKFGREGLIRYSTLAEAQGKGKTKLLRPRTVIYGGLLTGLAGTILFLVAMHSPIEVTLHRAPGTLFTMDDDGYVRNTYMLRVVNNDAARVHAYTVDVKGLDLADVTMPPLSIKPQDDVTVPLIIRTPLGGPSTVPLRVTIASETDMVEVNTTFKAPRAGEG